MVSAFVHGLAVALPQPIEGLRLLADPPTAHDVVVHEAAITPDKSEVKLGGQFLDSGQPLAFAQRSSGEVVATLSGEAIIAVSALGDRITVKRWDPLTVRLITDQVLPLVAELRGLTAVHATTVSLAGRAIAIAGPTGSGKSTLAGRLAVRGATLIAEDVSVMEPDEHGVFVRSGLITVRRRPERGEAPLAGDDGKLAATIRAEPEGAHLSAFVVLSPEDGAAPARRSDAMALLGHLFVPYVNDPGSLARHLDLAAAVARDASIMHVRTQVVSPAETEEALLQELEHVSVT
jgi:hypothetical protein